MPGVYNYVAAVHTQRIYGRGRPPDDVRSRSSSAAENGSVAAVGRRKAGRSESVRVVVIRAVKDYLRLVNGKRS
jgi:hypothetical protein